MRPRIFSAEFFYSFAFLTVSLAVMGLGLGALLLRLQPKLAQAQNAAALLVAPLHPSKGSSTTLLETLDKRGHVPLDSPCRRFAQEELAANLRRMIALCRQNQTPLVLCTLVSNDTGFAPAASSDPPLTGDLSAQWQA